MVCAPAFFASRFGLARLAAFALEEFETALEAFRQGQKLKGAGDSSDPRKYRTWIRKCEAELEAEEEVQAASGAATATAAATTAAATATDRGVPSEVAPASGGAVPGSAGAGSAKRTTPVLASSSAPEHLRIKFQYYQSYEKVTVAVLEKGLKESEVKVDVEAKRLTVRRKGDKDADGGGGALLFDKVLYEEVLPEKCRTRFAASKVGAVCCLRLHVTCSVRFGRWAQESQVSRSVASRKLGVHGSKAWQVATQQSVLPGGVVVITGTFPGLGSCATAKSVWIRRPLYLASQCLGLGLAGVIGCSGRPPRDLDRNLIASAGGVAQENEVMHNDVLSIFVSLAL